MHYHVHMAIASATGLKAKADKLFSRIIRHSGQCANCSYRCPFECDPRAGEHRKECKLQCAHIISRHLIRTRCEPRNAVPLCAKCHHWFTNWPVDFSRFLDEHLAPGEYDALKQTALGKTKVDWQKVLDGLEELSYSMRHDEV